MAEELGYPFDQIPRQAFISLAGGFGQATLCGTLGVASLAIGLVCDKDLQKELVAELLNWYRHFEFPLYQPAGLNLITTVADSVLCLDSVGNWMEKSGYAHGDAERKERCAGVTADVVNFTIELLNNNL